MKIDKISIRAHSGGRVCHIHCDGNDYSFPFMDLVEFDTYVAELLMLTEGLVPTNAVQGADRELLQIQSIYVEDAGERNKRCIASREITERRGEGQLVCGGAWYAEITINEAATDCSFTTLEELFQITQTIIRREMRNGGVIHRPAEIVAAAVAHG